MLWEFMLWEEGWVPAALEFMLQVRVPDKHLLRGGGVLGQLMLQVCAACNPSDTFGAYLLSHFC